MATANTKTVVAASHPVDSSVGLGILPLTEQASKITTTTTTTTAAATTRPTVPPLVTNKSASNTIWADNNNNTIEGSKVGGAGSNGHPTSNHFNNTKTTCTPTKTVTSTFHTNTHSNTNGMLKENGAQTIHKNGALRRLEENGYQMMPQELAYNNKLRKQDVGKTGVGIGPMGQQSQGNIKCHSEWTSGNSHGVRQLKEDKQQQIPRYQMEWNNGNHLGSGPGAWNGWQPESSVKTMGKEGWRNHPGHTSYYPHYNGTMTYPYGSAVPLQTSPLVISPSWNSHGWPLTLPPSSQTAHGLTAGPGTNNTTPNTHHPPNITNTMWQPPMTVSSNNSSPPYIGVPIQSSLTPITPIVAETLPKKVFQTHHTPVAGMRDTATCPKTVTTTTNTTFTTPSNKTITSSSSTPSQVMHAPPPNPYHPPYPGSGMDQTGYGYINQQHLVIMPYYQYGGMLTPYCQWPTPVMMQWPVTQHLPSTTTLQCTPTQTTVTSPKALGNSLPHAVLTFTTQSPRYATYASPQIKSTNLREGLQSPSYSNNSSPHPPPIPIRGSHLYFNRRSSYNGQPVQMAPCHCSPTTTTVRNGEQSQQHKNGKPPSYPGRVTPVVSSVSPNKLSSAAPVSPIKISSVQKVASSPYHFPITQIESTIDNSGMMRQFTDSSPEAGIQPWQQVPNGSCSNMLMTPPPTPIEENNDTLILNGT
ncbi:hypothetical protein Pcinc_027487 [Petrolisthes cinctipes]|uniref:Uncharacterized protein n=1 Tax=Petrolisthes cinctipes TaxID=88211 RepID=A0AAE1F5X4_PETCI|nr:hypothetical protein Pcinc_027487 [Petrolisthes cinctipes]